MGCKRGGLIGRSQILEVMVEIVRFILRAVEVLSRGVT